jgi:hypothetical protein
MDVRYGTAEVLEFGSLKAASVDVQAGATLIIRGLHNNPGYLVAAATMTSSALTVEFSGDPTSGSQYVLIDGATVKNYTPVLTGTSATGTYNSATSTLTID